MSTFLHTLQPINTFYWQLASVKYLRYLVFYRTLLSPVIIIILYVLCDQ